MDKDLRRTFRDTVEEGDLRVSRSWSALLATGAVGGIDLSVGILALLIVLHATGSRLLAAVAFGIGFLALVLAKSELFTENFLVPVVAFAARSATALEVLRLWLGTLVMNLLGGWAMMGLAMVGFPQMRDTAIEVGRFYPELGLGARSFALAVLAGAVITLMTWMEQGAQSMGVKLVAAWAVAFVLAAGPLNHVVVSSLEMFAALQATAPFGYLDFLGAMSWAALGNLVGGLGLVTIVRIVQVGREALAEEQARPRREVEEAEAEGADVTAPDARPDGQAEQPARRAGD